MTFHGTATAADAQRVQREAAAETKKFIYDFKKVLQETDGADSTTALYTQSLEDAYGDLVSQHQSSTSSYYNYDALGSTHALLSSAEAETDAYNFKAFGEINASTGSTPNPFTFVGKYGYYEDSQIDLYFLNARYYDPDSARFLSEDPIDSDANMYRYVGNNPLNHADPSGNESIPEWIKKAEAAHIKGADEELSVLRGALADVSKRSRNVPSTAPEKIRNIPDPFAETGSALWHLLIGEDKIPWRKNVKAKDIELWVSENRIPGDAWLWHCDWPVWQPADAIFPRLAEIRWIRDRLQEEQAERQQVEGAERFTEKERAIVDALRPNQYLPPGLVPYTGRPITKKHVAASNSDELWTDGIKGGIHYARSLNLWDNPKSVKVGDMVLVRDLFGKLAWRPKLIPELGGQIILSDTFLLHLVRNALSAKRKPTAEEKEKKPSEHESGVQVNPPSRRRVRCIACHNPIIMGGGSVADLPESYRRAIRAWLRTTSTEEMDRQVQPLRDQGRSLREAGLLGVPSAVLGTVSRQVVSPLVKKVGSLFDLDEKESLKLAAAIAGTLEAAYGVLLLVPTGGASVYLILDGASMARGAIRGEEYDFMGRLIDKLSEKATGSKEAGRTVRTLVPLFVALSARPQSVNVKLPGIKKVGDFHVPNPFAFEGFSVPALAIEGVSIPAIAIEWTQVASIPVKGLGTVTLLQMSGKSSGAPKKPRLTPDQLARQKFLKRAKLGGELDSAKNLHLFENRGLTVKEYIARFRKGSIKEVLPSEAAGMTVEQALRAGKVGDVNVRKLILDLRDKFVK